MEKSKTMESIAVVIMKGREFNQKNTIKKKLEISKCLDITAISKVITNLNHFRVTELNFPKFNCVNISDNCKIDFATLDKNKWTNSEAADNEINGFNNFFKFCFDKNHLPSYLTSDLKEIRLTYN